MGEKMRSKNPTENNTPVAVVSRVPPDGGWGWFVVFGSFMIHIVSDGVTYSFGVLFTELLKVFHGTKAETSWIASLLVGVTLCSGPIASVFVNKYGCRVVTIAGSILASICMLVSVYAESLLTLYLTLGLGTGFGFGLIYLPAIVSVTCYFDKYRSMATGIAVCGSGLGTFLFAPIVSKLIIYYNWKVTLEVISGLVLMCSLFGMLFRPLPMDEDQDDEATHQLHSGDNSGGAPNVILNIVEPPADECEPFVNGDVGRSQSYNHIPNSDDNGGGGGGGGGDDDEQWQQQLERTVANKLLLANEVNTNTFGNDLDKQSRFTLSQPALIAAAESPVSNSRPRLNSHHQRGDVYATQHLKTTHMPSNGGSGIMYQKDIFYSGSLLNLNNMQYRRRTMSQSKNIEMSLIKPIENDRISDGVCCSADAKNTIKQLLDFTLLKDPIFILYTCSNFLTSVGFNIPFVYIMERAKVLGIPEDTSNYLLSFLGIANTVGRIVLGIISDKPWTNRLMVYIVCLTICGLATVLSTLCTDMISLTVYTLVFGSTIGAYVGLTSVILVDLLGIDKLTNAFGILLLFQGIASLIGPPIAGWLYDLLESYDPAFYLSGVTIGVSGLMLLVIPCMQRWEQ